MAIETATGVYAFYEDTLPEWGIASILLAESEQGDVFYPVKPICEALGIDAPTQRGIIRQDSRTKPGAHDISAPTRGGKQTVLYLRRHETGVWLAMIDPARVSDKLKGEGDDGKTPRERLLDFQSALWALADRIAFRRRQGVEASAGNPTSVARLVGGYARAETHCPDCGAPLVAEVEDGELRLTHK